MKPLIIILFISLSLVRFINLTSIPIFGDESLYLSLAYDIFKNPFVHAFDSIAYGVMPVFIWFESLTQVLFSQLLNPLFLARTFSIIVDLTSAIFIYLIGKTLFNQKYAIISTLIYISLPLTFFHSRFSMLETTTNLFIVGAIFLALQKKLPTLKLITLTLLIVLAFFTKPLAVVSFLAIALAPLLIHGFKPSKLTGYFLAFTLTGLVCLSLYLPIKHQLTKFISPYQLTSLQALSLFKSNLYKTLVWLKTYLTLPISISTFIMFFISLFKKTPQLIWLTFWLLQAALISSYFSAYFFPRHLFLLAPPIALLTGYFFYQVLKIKPIMACLILFFSLLPAFYLNSQIIINPKKAPIVSEDKQQLYQNWNSGVGLKEISQDLVNLSVKQPITVFVKNDPSVTWPLGYLYSTGNASIIPFDQLPTSFTNDHPTYLVLALNTDLPTNQKVSLVSSYPRGPNYSIDLFRIQP